MVAVQYILLAVAGALAVAAIVEAILWFGHHTHAHLDRIAKVLEELRDFEALK